MDGEQLGGLVGGGGLLLLLLLLFFQVPILGHGPIWSKQIWVCIIRVIKKGDRRPWSWTQVDDLLYVSSLPREVTQIEELQTPPYKLKAIVSLVEEWELAVSSEQLQALGLDNLVLPTPDYSAPSIQNILTAVEFIDAHIAQGHGVLVHCNAGRGRSVVVAIAYLIMRHQHEGWTPEAVYDMIRGKRAIASMRALGGIKSQWHAVKKFQKYLRRQGGVLRSRARAEAAEDLVPPQAPAQAWVVGIEDLQDGGDAATGEERTPHELGEAQVSTDGEGEQEESSQSLEEGKVALPGAAATVDADEKV